MVMERLDAARKHPENQSELRQFAITQARKLLRAAEVVDPGLRTSKKHEGRSVLIETETPSNFSARLREEVQILPGDLPVGSLLYCNEYTRKHVINWCEQHKSEYYTEKARQIRELPASPESWVVFQGSVTGVDRGSLTRLLGLVTRLNNKALSVRIDEVEEALIIYRSPETWGKTERLAHHAFSLL